MGELVLGLIALLLFTIVGRLFLVSILSMSVAVAQRLLSGGWIFLVIVLLIDLCR